MYRVRGSGIHGKGVFAVRRIRKGTRIIEYTGRRISDAEADRLYQGNGSNHHYTLLFSVGKDVNIDAGRNGNVARYINHSCDPNCESVDEDGRIFIEAIRTIEPGEELSYDYGFSGPPLRTKAEREMYACHCGAGNCRGTMYHEFKPRRKRVTGKPDSRP